MPQPGRSLDDLPLAAYSTGVDPETEPEMEPDATAPPAAPIAPSVPAAPFAAAAGVRAPGPFDAPATEPPADEAEAASGTIGARARDFARRNPRPVAGAAFVGMILVGVLLLTSGGGAPSAAGASASPSAPPVVVVADPGSATLVLTGSLTTTYTLTGNAGQPVSGNAVTAAWADANQDVLTLAGPVDRGTRTTDAGLVLTWGLMIDGKLVTFTSDDGECTIGMASNPKGVSGSFACRKLKSDDGRYTVGASGTYRT